MPTHRKVAGYGSPNSSKNAGFTTRSYNIVCYACEGRGVKIMGGEIVSVADFLMALNYHFNHVKRCFVSAKTALIKKEQSPIRFLSGENCFGAVALCTLVVFQI